MAGADDVLEVDGKSVEMRSVYTYVCDVGGKVM